MTHDARLLAVELRAAVGTLDSATEDWYLAIADTLERLERERDALKELCHRAAGRFTYIRNGASDHKLYIDPNYCLGNEDMIRELRAAAGLDDGSEADS
jgi:hypothetical protein